jgi:hypothetical protein
MLNRMHDESSCDFPGICKNAIDDSMFNIWWSLLKLASSDIQHRCALFEPSSFQGGG